MKTFFIDTEFNGDNGDLISMALVPLRKNEDPFYEVLPCDSPVAWVAKHVIPVLEKEPVTLRKFRNKLEPYLRPPLRYRVFLQSY